MFSLSWIHSALDKHGNYVDDKAHCIVSSDLETLRLIYFSLDKRYNAHFSTIIVGAGTPVKL